MIGPTVDRSIADGELVGGALFGEALPADATALTTGALLGDAAGGGDELGISLADVVDAAADEIGALLATAAT